MQGWLLDTNVLSETVRPQPDAAVMAWLDSLQAEQLYISVLTLGELQKGVRLLADGKRGKTLSAWLDTTLPAWFEDRVLVIDAPVAERWAELLAHERRPLPAIDSLLAATALRHGLGLATRNVKDFGFEGLVVHSPWEAAKA